MGPDEFTLDYALLAALLLATIHFCGPVIRRSLRGHGELASSFGGGIAVAYVFLSLFPEVELAHEWLDDSVHLVTLVSFLFFYGLEAWLVLRRQPFAMPGVAPVSGGESAEAVDHLESVFWWHIALSWIYTAMVVFALPEESREDLGFVIVGTVAVGLHLIYKDFVLRSHHHERFQDKGRYLLAAAPLVGWLAHQITDPSNAVFDIFVALVAGFLMQGVFRDELPQAHAVRLHWMVGGAATFAALALLTG